MGVLNALYRFFSLPSLKEKQQVRAFRRVGRLCRAKLKGFEFLRVKFESSGAGATRARKNSNPASPGQTVR